MNKVLVLFTKEVYINSLIKSLELCGLEKQISYIIYPDSESLIMGKKSQNKTSSLNIVFLKYLDFQKLISRGNWSFNLGISFMFSHIFSEEIIKLFNKGIINFHPSLLPLNKGANPVTWAIYNNTSHGVTAHLVDTAIDNGPILKQYKIEVRCDHTAEKLYSESIKELEKLLVEVVPGWLKNEITPLPPLGPSSLHLIEDLKRIKFKDLSEIDDAAELLKLLRATSFSGKNGLRLKIGSDIFDLYLQIERLNEN
jgi:methionyl-tRNA formyltransferase